MAHQFFVNHKRPPPRSPPLSPPRSSFSSLPPSLSQTALAIYSQQSFPAPLKPAFKADSLFHPVPYPRDIPSTHSTPHSHITIEPIRTAHIPSLTRITGVLLPIRYPSSFYSETVTDPVVASLSRVAIYHDYPVSPARDQKYAAPDKVIGGIRCRLERLSPSPGAPNGATTNLHRASPSSHAERLQPPREPTNLYIQTLHLLSPYRGFGVAASLLNSLLFSAELTPTANPTAASRSPSASPLRLSDLVRHYNIRTVTAHVHEANDEALRWYVARGFCVEDGVIDGYYRRLKPSGARLVRLTLPRDDEHVECGEHTRAATDIALNDAATTTSPSAAWPGTAGFGSMRPSGVAADGGGTTDETNDAEPQPEEDDDDWEKVEALDCEDHGLRVHTLGDSSRLLLDNDLEDSRRRAGTRKRKAVGEP